MFFMYLIVRYCIMVNVCYMMLYGFVFHFTQVLYNGDLDLAGLLEFILLLMEIPRGD